MPKVLITGASGFIGRHVLASLTAPGVEVIGLSRKKPPSDLAQSARWKRLDLLKATATEMEAVCAGLEGGLLIHLAWETDRGGYRTKHTNLDWLAASIRLCRAFIDAGGSRIVAAGTCAEYGAPPDGPCVESKTPIAPKGLYGVTKDALRRVLKGLQDAGDVRFAWARIFFTFGMFEKPDRLVPSVIDALLDGREAQCSSGSQVRDYIDVRDCGAALVALAMSDVTGEVNIGSGQPLQLGDIAMRIGTLMEAPNLIRLGALPDRPDEASNLWADVGRLTREVGFRGTYNLDAGLLDAIGWRKAIRSGHPSSRVTEPNPSIGPTGGSSWHTTK